MVDGVKTEQKLPLYEWKKLSLYEWKKIKSKSKRRKAFIATLDDMQKSQLEVLCANAKAHYRRMIDWAKAQPQYEVADVCVMKKLLNEAWGGRDCSYCLASLHECDDCILGVDKSEVKLDGIRCCDGLWHEMSTSSSWEEWIIRAEKVYKYISHKGVVQ